MRTKPILTPEDLELVPTKVLARAIMDRSKGFLLLMEPLGHPSDDPHVYTQGEPDELTSLARIARRAVYLINRNDSDDLGIAE